MFKINKKEIIPGIISLQFANQYEVASTMMRVQEFYESPFKKMYGKYFTLESCMDEYAKSFGNFSYTIDWGGFNIPDNVFRKFLVKFKHDLLKKEKHLESLFVEELSMTRSFYIIAHSETKTKVNLKNIESILSHEFCHGLYYLNKEYKEKTSNLIGNMSQKKISSALIKKGYAKNVIDDEIQAYLSTSSPNYSKQLFGHSFSKECKQFRKNLTPFLPK